MNITDTLISQNATDAVMLTFASARLHSISPRVNKFSVDFVCTLPEPSAATTTAAGFAGLQLAAFGTSGNRRLGRSCARVNNIYKGCKSRRI